MYEELLRSIYYNPAAIGSFGGVNILYKQAKRQNPKIKLKDVKDWVRSQFVYTVHKPAFNRFKRNKIIIFSPNEQYFADLIDVRNLSRHNNGYKYILTVIDGFSKLAWAFPLKFKTPKEVLKAFQKLFESGNVPSKLQAGPARARSPACAPTGGGCSCRRAAASPPPGSTTAARWARPPARRSTP